ncbi:putative metalloprotease CJM1_0395 family protein [Shewanella zhangzhouensis]|uniref:putative metalloprotease CJM1_0395 family protein n=1 Tax=Shewanella zhangzhouensis TaxID=2864213 RepID=UPI0021AD2C87|nr:putative metalloprotease CJM1_0395 family protein [Shewanella zhangzhouensis]
MSSPALSVNHAASNGVARPSFAGHPDTAEAARNSFSSASVVSEVSLKSPSNNASFHGAAASGITPTATSVGAASSSVGNNQVLKSSPSSAILPSAPVESGRTTGLVRPAASGARQGGSAPTASANPGFNLITGAQSINALPGRPSFASAISAQGYSSANQGYDVRLSPAQGTGFTGAGEYSVADIFISQNQAADNGVAMSGAVTGRAVSQDGGGAGSNAVFDAVSPLGAQLGREDASGSAVSDQESQEAAKEARQQQLAEALGGESGSTSALRAAEQQAEQDSNAQAMARKSAMERREQVKVRQQEMEVRQLEARQAEVLAHERAHAAVGGQFARAPNFEYELGPDGKRYATGGEVSIDIASVHGNPQATINKMQQVYAAAMAPVNPSQADLSVAAEALRKIELAKDELASERLAAMPTQDELSPLLDAQNAIDEVPVFEPVTPSLGTNLDKSGALSKEQGDSGFVDALSARITAALAQTFERGSEGASAENQINDDIATEGDLIAADTGLDGSGTGSDSYGQAQDNSRTTDISKLGPPRAILAYLDTNEKTQTENDKSQRREKTSSLLALA